MKRIIYIISAVLAVAACSDAAVDPDEGYIRLSAGVSHIDVSTRSGIVPPDPYEGTGPLEGNALDAKILFSTDRSTYQNAPEAPTYLPCHTFINYVNAAPKDPEPYDGNKLKYPTDDTPVYCVGFYPTSWTVSDDGKTAEHEMDGITDLMFAKEISGRWSSNFGQQTYRHLLSWIKVYMCGTTHDASDFWGEITSIKIQSKNNVRIELFNDASDGSKVTYGGADYNFPIFEGSQPLHITIHEIGSSFCCPALSYTITVETTEAGTKSIDIPLVDKDGNALTSIEEAAGRLFVLELYFHPMAVIEGKCILKAWDYKDENIYLN